MHSVRTLESTTKDLDRWLINTAKGCCVILLLQPISKSLQLGIFPGWGASDLYCHRLLASNFLLNEHHPTKHFTFFFLKQIGNSWMQALFQQCGLWWCWHILQTGFRVLGQEVFPPQNQRFYSSFMRSFKYFHLLWGDVLRRRRFLLRVFRYLEREGGRNADPLVGQG